MYVLTCLHTVHFHVTVPFFSHKGEHVWQEKTKLRKEKFRDLCLQVHRIVINTP